MRVSMVLRCRPTRGALAAALRSRALQRLVQRTPDDELARLPDHVAALG